MLCALGTHSRKYLLVYLFILFIHLHIYLSLNFNSEPGDDKECGTFFQGEDCKKGRHKICLFK